MKNREHKLEIKNPGDLLDAWADSYDFSKNKIYNYYTFEKNTDAFIQKVSKIAKNNKLKYALTLHSGASLIAPFVRFTDIHLYFLGDLSTWIKKLELKPIEFGGTVHLVEPFDEGVFYGVQTINDIKVASNIQLYLDLCNYPARGREQAEFLRKEKINF
jgi:hypothetical protein